MTRDKGARNMWVGVLWNARTYSKACLIRDGRHEAGGIGSSDDDEGLDEEHAEQEGGGRGK